MSDERAGGADFLQLSRESAPGKGKTAWLTGELRTAVRDGRLADGTRLPATRTLAEDLGVARGVVVQAYQQLTEEGLLSAGPRRGTVVRDGRVDATRAPEVALPEPAGRFHSPGLPDLTLFPRAAWLRAERDVLRTATRGDLGYGDPRGAPALRAQLAGWLGRTRGLSVTAGQLVVVSGVAQAFALLATVLRHRGVRRIGVEDPGSGGTRAEFAYWGLAPQPVPVDGDGLDVAVLRDTAPPCVLTTPAHQFPTGVALSPDRRRALLGWAREQDALIIEDDYDAEYRYDRAPVPALHAQAPQHIAYTSSTSKALAPALRLGWLIAPAGLAADVVEAKHFTDISSPALSQLVLAQLLAGGAYERHLRRARNHQRQRRNAMVAAIHAHLPGAAVTGIAAGLHLLLTRPGRPFPDAAVAAELTGRGTPAEPLSIHRVRPGEPGLLLGYAAQPTHRAETTARLIAELLGRH